MIKGSKIFAPTRGLGCVSNHLPLQVRYIKSRKENLIITCVGKSFHTYGISHFGLLSVSGLHPSDITAMGADAYHVYTSCSNEVYAWRRGTELKHIYKGHEHRVHLLLPFGVHLISIDEGNNLKLWDIKAESIALELHFDNKSFQITAVMHPSTYINKILLGSKQGELQLWNVNTGKMIYAFAGWGSSVKCLAQAPAMDVVAIGLESGGIILHNLKFDETLMRFQQDWGAITSISFRSDDRPIMATGSLPGHIVFWDLEEKRIASQLLSAHKDAVTGMVCLPSEPLVLTSSADNTLKLWIFDMTDGGARLLRIREGHSASPTSIRFHGSNGQNILSAARDSTLRIFNTQTEQFNKSLGRATYNRSASKKRGRLEEDPLVMPPIVQFTSGTTREKEWDNIACLHLGLPMVTTWSYDKLKMGKLKLLPERLHKANKNLDANIIATSLALTHCGNFVLIGYSDGFADRFNVQSGQWRCSYGKDGAHEVAVRGIASDSLNQIVATGCREGIVKFWKFKECKAEVKSFLPILHLEESIQFFRSHHECSLVAIALEDFTIQVLDFDTKSIIRKFAGHGAQITDAAFSPNSRWLLTSGFDHVIRTWDIASAQLVDHFCVETPCTSLDFSPTGEALITAHVDHLGIFLWTNRTLYQRVSLKALDINDQPVMIQLPHVSQQELPNDFIDEDVEEFQSPAQISNDLVTLSGLATSRWLNLLNIDVIRRRNKPKLPPKVAKSAPFFLPTLQSLDFAFDLSQTAKVHDEKSSTLGEVTLPTNLSPLGVMLSEAESDEHFEKIFEKLKSIGPSMLEHEVNSLAPEGGGTIGVMHNFLKCIAFMLKSNLNFELAQAYLALFLKSHGDVIANEKILRDYLPNIHTCATDAWQRIQAKLMYNLCIVQHAKNLA